MKYKGKMILSIAGVVISIAVFVISAVLTENAVISHSFATALIVISMVLVFVAIFFAAKVDYETSVYECKKCGYVFKPTLKAYFLGAHTLTTRRLKCPECAERSWCKRVIAK